MDTTNIVIQAAAAGMFVKVLVDIIKMSPLPSPSALLPILALVFGQLASFLLFLSGGGTLSTQTIATVALVGILAAGSAISVTVIQNKSNEPSIK
jgi:hypothetical protein